MFVDTHCHLDFDAFFGRIDALKHDMTQLRLEMVVIPSVAASNWDAVIKLCGRDDRFYYALGLHPYLIEQHNISDIQTLENRVSALSVAKQNKLIALGEMGLDASKPDVGKQIELFEMQLMLAQEYGYPVIVHVRKLHNEVLRILRKYAVSGVVHAFSGSYELLLQYVGLGFKIGVGPVITWATSRKTRMAIAKAPISSLVLETDAPDMYASGVDKDKSSPLDVVRVFETLSQIRPESKNDLNDCLLKNSYELFNKKDKDIKSSGN